MALGHILCISSRCSLRNRYQPHHRTAPRLAQVQYLPSRIPIHRHHLHPLLPLMNVKRSSKFTQKSLPHQYPPPAPLPPLRVRTPPLPRPPLHPHRQRLTHLPLRTPPLPPPHLPGLHQSQPGHGLVIFITASSPIFQTIVYFCLLLYIMIVFLICAFLYLHASWLHGNLGITDSLTSHIDVFEYLPIDYQLRLSFPLRVPQFNP
jgi:hypothetical protein